MYSWQMVWLCRLIQNFYVAFGYTNLYKRHTCTADTEPTGLQHVYSSHKRALLHVTLLGAGRSLLLFDESFSEEVQFTLDQPHMLCRGNKCLMFSRLTASSSSSSSTSLLPIHSLYTHSKLSIVFSLITTFSLSSLLPSLPPPSPTSSSSPFSLLPFPFPASFPLPHSSLPSLLLHTHSLSCSALSTASPLISSFFLFSSTAMDSRRAFTCCSN